MDLGLEGAKAAVSGASQGRGYAIALALSAEGADVAICSRREDAVAKAASTIEVQTNRSVVPITADVSTVEGCTRFIEQAADELGGLRILVCNSGGPPPGMPDSFDDRVWQESIELVFMSVVRMTRAALPHLIDNTWSRILSITSSFVKQPSAYMALSTSSRAAVTGYLKSLSLAYAARGLTVNTIVPGQLLTERLRSLSGAPSDADAHHGVFASIVEAIPVGRLGDPNELGAVAAFLCSSKASFVDGVDLRVDGGHIRSI
ncbi:MAG: SDR family oxidoreductase [Actinomycetota bacterium]